MKNATSIGMLATVVFAVGMVGINFSDGTFVLLNETPTYTMEGGSLSGHIEIIHADSEGNILSYQQTDNAIVNDGRNCTAMLLFGGSTHPLGTGCRAQDAAGLGKYTVIGVGNGTVLGGGTSQTDTIDEVNDNGIVRITGTLGNFLNSTNTGDPAVQRITAQFTWLGSTTNTINQAGLFNDTTAGPTSSTFALKNFPSPVAMNTNDQLTVNWDITIDGTDAYGP